MIRVCVFIASVLCAPAVAQEMNVPDNARLTANRGSDLDTYSAPVGVFAEGAVPVQVIEGPVMRQSWRINGQSATTLQLLVPLREQLLDSEYDIKLNCADVTCGGFDFRFGIEILPAPNMVVNLRDYHFLTAIRGPENAPLSAITVLVSSTDTAAFVQIIRVGEKKKASAAGLRTDGVEVKTPIVSGDMSQALTTTGHVILHDLTFETGSSKLGAGPFGTLTNLAQFLKQNPGVRVALVGHTDAVGSLNGNIALSKARAQSVAQVLKAEYDIPSAQVEAEGMGYLSPVATNLLEAGREANRRVEVVLLSSDTQKK